MIMKNTVKPLPISLLVTTFKIKRSVIVDDVSAEA